MMIRRWIVKMLAMPSAKHRIMDRTPSLDWSSQLCFQRSLTKLKRRTSMQRAIAKRCRGLHAMASSVLLEIWAIDDSAARRGYGAEPAGSSYHCP